MNINCNVDVTLDSMCGVVSNYSVCRHSNHQHKLHTLNCLLYGSVT